MSKTKIEWCARPGTKPEVWNLVTGCDKVSQGCKNCYAEVMHRRLQVMKPDKYNHPFLGGAHIHEDVLSLPFTWKTPRTVFVNSMSDLFHQDVSLAFVAKVFTVMALCPQHTFIILTKRPERALEYYTSYENGLVDVPCEKIIYDNNLNDLLHGEDYQLLPHLESAGWFWETTIDWVDGFKNASLIYDGPLPLPNVWLLASVEHQAAADKRIPLLLQCPAEVRGLSCEPLLGPLQLSKYLSQIDWVIAGGESGHKARPVHPVWLMALRNQCKAYNLPFFFKQWGEYMPAVKGTAVDPKNKHFKFARRDGETSDIFYGPFIDEDLMYRAGKKKAGRLLDGIEYNEFPLTIK